MRPLVVALLAFALAPPAGGQISVSRSVVCLAGGLASAAGGSAAFTLGEPITGTVSGRGVAATQGFQQPPASRAASAVSRDRPQPLRTSPNPASDEFSLELPRGVSPRVDWVIRDLAGQTLLRGSLSRSPSGGRAAVDVSRLPVGTYVLRLRAAGTTYGSVIAVAR